MSWLSKFLGLDDLITELGARHIDHINDYRDVINSYRERENYLNSEIQRLTNLILTEHGVIAREGQVNIRPSGPPQPVNKRASWPQKQREYEQADKILAQSNSHALLDYWTKKDQQAGLEQ